MKCEHQADRFQPLEPKGNWGRLPISLGEIGRRPNSPLVFVIMSGMTRQLNKYSSKITQPKSQGASQAMLYATGLSEDDMDKAQVGISSVWYEGNSCNMHLLQLAEKVKEGVRLQAWSVSGSIQSA